MGQNVSNVETVTDFSTNESCVRLHLDLPMPAEAVSKVASDLKTGDVRSAFATIRRHTTSSETDVIGAFEAAHTALHADRAQKAA